jgi:hypothetical protein
MVIILELVLVAFGITLALSTLLFFLDRSFIDFLNLTWRQLFSALAPVVIGGVGLVYIVSLFVRIFVVPDMGTNNNIVHNHFYAKDGLNEKSE